MRIARNSLALCMLALVGAAPLCALAQERDLFVQSAGPPLASDPDLSPIWIVDVDGRAPSASSEVLYREKFSEQKFTTLSKIPARTLAVTSNGSELVLLLQPASGGAESANWAWYSPSRFAYGPRLPEQRIILALAGDRQSLWALGRAPVIAGTQPASRPATQPSPPPILYLLRPGQNGFEWQPQPAQWPDDLSFSPADELSMAIIDARPTLARYAEPGVVHVLQYAHGHWRQIQRYDVGSPRRFRLLNRAGKPLLWCQLDPQNDDPKGSVTVGEVLTAASPETPAIIRVKEPGPNPADIDAVVISDNLRVFFNHQEKTGERLVGQEFRPDGVPAGTINAVQILPTQDANQFQWVAVAVVAVLTIFVLNTLFRRRAASRDDDDRED